MTFQTVFQVLYQGFNINQVILSCVTDELRSVLLHRILSRLARLGDTH